MPSPSDRRQEIVIEVGGMTESGSERRVVEALSAVSGVSAATASRHEGQAIVTADPSLATPQKLREAVAGAGFEAGEVRFPE